MQNRRNHIIILLLCAVSGVVDVLGYIGLSHVFTANMTGNIVLLGIGIGDGRQAVLSNAALSLAGFIVGIAAAVFVQRRTGRLCGILFWEFVLLLLVAITVMLFPINGGVSSAILVLLSSAMGLQTIAGRNLNIAGLSSTVLTSTLAAFVEDIMKTKKNNTRGLSLDIYLRAGAILLYMGGAAIGSLSERIIGLFTIWIAVGLLVLVLLLQKKTTHA